MPLGEIEHVNGIILMVCAAIMYFESLPWTSWAPEHPAEMKPIVESELALGTDCFRSTFSIKVLMDTIGYFGANCQLRSRRFLRNLAIQRTMA